MAKTVTITELLPPTGVAISLVAGGTLAASTTYYYRIVAVEYLGSNLRCENEFAMSAPTAEFSIATDATNRSVKLDWTGSTKIKGSNYLAYIIFRTTVSGDYSAAASHMIRAANADSGCATTLVNAVTYTDSNTYPLQQAFQFPLGVPVVEIDGGTSVDRIDEEFIYQAYVAQGKAANFAVRTSLTYGSGVTYSFKGIFRISFTTQCYWKINSGRTVTIEGRLMQNSNVDFAMGTATGNGAMMCLAGVNGDGAHGLYGTFNIYNSKIIDLNAATGATGAGSYYGSLDSFNNISGNSGSQSLIQDSAIHMYGSNSNMSGNISIVNTIMEVNPRLETSGAPSLSPLLVGITIRGNSLYTYGASYVVLKKCSIVATTNEMWFHGGSLTALRFIDLIDFTSTFTPLRAAVNSNPAGTWYLRRWSLNITAVDASNNPLQNVSVAVFDKIGISSVFVDSGTFASTNVALTDTTVSAIDGTRFSNNDNIKLGAEVMAVTNRVGNTLTTTRAQQNTQINAWGGFDRKLWIQKNAVLTDAAGKIPEQYLTAETHQGNAAKSSPYQYDTVTYTPHTITIRRYGYQSVSVTQSVSAPIVLRQMMAANPFVAASESTASAYAGITISGATRTITLTIAHTLQELYDYSQWWAAQSANMQYSEPITTSDGQTFSSTYALTIDTVALTGTGSLNLGANTLTLTNGGSSTLNITAADGTHTTITLTGLTAGSRVQLYDNTGQLELYNAVVAGTSLTIPAVWTADHSIRVRVMYVFGATAKRWYETTGVLTKNGMNQIVAQTDDPVYNTIAIDGSTVTECSISGTALIINITDPDNTTTAQRLYAFEVYWLSTVSGIRDQALYIDATDSTHFVFEGGLKIRNATANPLQITGGNIVPVSGPATDVMDTSGGPIFLNFNRVEGMNLSQLLTLEDYLALRN